MPPCKAETTFNSIALEISDQVCCMKRGRAINDASTAPEHIHTCEEASSITTRRLSSGRKLAAVAGRGRIAPAGFCYRRNFLPFPVLCPRVTLRASPTNPIILHLWAYACLTTSMGKALFSSS